MRILMKTVNFAFLYLEGVDDIKELAWHNAYELSVSRKHFT